MEEETFLSSIRPGSGQCTHIALQNKQEKNAAGNFLRKSHEELLASAGTEIQMRGQTSSPAGRLVGRDHSVYRIPVKQANMEGNSQRSYRECGERRKCQTGKTVKKCTTMYCRKCNVGPYIQQCFEVYHTKLNYRE